MLKFPMRKDASVQMERGFLFEIFVRTFSDWLFAPHSSVAYTHTLCFNIG